VVECELRVCVECWLKEGLLTTAILCLEAKLCVCVCVCVCVSAVSWVWLVCVEVFVLL